MVGALMVGGYMEREIPRETRYAASEAGMYRSFAWAAQSYMAANPTFSGTLTWDALRAAETTPPAMREVNLNPSWKVVANDGNWVICAQLSERAVAALGQLMPQTAKPVRTVVQGSENVWMGDPAQAESEVTKCL